MKKGIFLASAIVIVLITIFFFFVYKTKMQILETFQIQPNQNTGCYVNSQSNIRKLFFLKSVPIGYESPRWQKSALNGAKTTINLEPRPDLSGATLKAISVIGAKRPHIYSVIDQSDKSIEVCKQNQFDLDEGEHYVILVSSKPGDPDLKDELTVNAIVIKVEKGFLYSFSGKFLRRDFSAGKTRIARVLY